MRRNQTIYCTILLLNNWPLTIPFIVLESISCHPWKLLCTLYLVKCDRSNTVWKCVCLLLYIFSTRLFNSKTHFKHLKKFVKVVEKNAPFFLIWHFTAHCISQEKINIESYCPIFPGLENAFFIFQVFHDFPGCWEPCRLYTFLQMSSTWKSS